MLRSITIDNFKSLINVTYGPGALNLVIGENNSGKTNLCQALRFLGLTSHLPLVNAAARVVGDPSNLSNAYFNKPTIDFTCTCDLTIEGEARQFDYSLSIKFTRPESIGHPTRPIPMTIGVQAETLKVSGGPFHSTVLLGARVRPKKPGDDVAAVLTGTNLPAGSEVCDIGLLDETRFLAGEPKEECGIGLSFSPDSTALCSLYYRETNKHASAFKSYLESWLYYDLDALRLRTSEAKPFDFELNPDGSNLASVLYNLKNTNERYYRQLVEIVRALEPKLDVINFIAPTQDQVYMFVEDDQGHRFPVPNLSNGTLRFLALACVIVSARIKDQNRRPSPPLIVIEEPENGIYVRRLRKLFDLIDPSGAGGQFIFTSHSPYFIDLFEDNLENVVVMKRHETHSELAKLDQQKAEKYLEEMPLGELHFREMLV
jgi:predicted ATPase